MRTLRAGIVLATMAIILVATTTICAMTPRNQVIEVESLTWKRVIEVERYETVTRRGRGVPQGGRIISSYMRQVGVNRVGKNSMPVYAMIYTYEIEAWVRDGDVVSFGLKGTNPYWPDFNPSGPTGPNGTGKQRTCGSSESYIVTDAEGREYTTSKHLWESLNPGDKREFKVHRDGWIEEEGE